MIQGLLSVLFVIGCVRADPFPSDLERCNFGDNECLKNRVNLYVRTLAGGHEGLDLPKIDPLYLKELDIIRGAGGPVAINLKFKDVLFGGLSNLTMTKAVGFERDTSKSKFEMYVIIPKASLVGQYKMRADILFLPIVGNGKANLTFDNLDANIKCKNVKLETKEDGKQYANFAKASCKFDFEIKRLWMDFQNLFNGDKLLSTTTNAFLNDNWELLVGELKAVLKKTFSDTFQTIVGRVYDKVPYDELFI